MATDTDHKKEFEEAYNLAHSGWGKWLPEAEIDLKMVAGDQWTPEWKTYLTSQNRSLGVFNRVRRVVKIVSGYQRKNRLSLKVESHHFGDESLADQHTAVLMKMMGSGPGSGRGYAVMSDAFEAGPLITGANLVEPYLDFESKVRFKRLPYNKFLLDPLLTERDLSDCRFIIRGEPVSKKDAMMLMPERAAEIESLSSGVSGRKFNMAAYSQNMAAKDMLRYEEFWQQTSREQILLIDRNSGQEIPYEGNRAQLQGELRNDFQRFGYERFATSSKTVRTVELQIFLQDEMFYRGPDPYGMDEYRFVPMFGMFYPELVQEELKLQGLVRSIRDPQREFNKRMSQQMDIIESQINTGYDAIEGSVANPDSLYKAGQGKTTWMKGKTDNPVGLDAIRRKEPAQIPASFFQLSDQIATLMDVIPGMNEELFGTEQKQIPGILSKMRTGAALTILQDLFDYYRDAKCLLGHKLIKLGQKNFDPQRVQKMLGPEMLGPEMQLHPSFYTEDVDSDDVSVTEGLMTDSQKEMYYQEIKDLRVNVGVAVPDTAMIDAAPMQFKDRLKQQIQVAEQAQAAQQQQQQRIQDLTNQLLMSQIAENQAQAGERETETENNRTSSDLNRAKTLVELAKLTNTPVSLVNDLNRGTTAVKRKPTEPEKRARKKK